MTTSPTIIPTTAELRSRRTETTARAGDILRVLAWRDPAVEQLPGAVRTDSDEALVWWTPSLGTIAMAMAHRFARHATDGPSEWTVEDIARTFGVGTSAGRVERSLMRLQRFRIVHRSGSTLAVRLWLPPLTRRQRDQLPVYLAAAYDAR